MGELRTRENQQKYQALIDQGLLKDGCALCEKPALQSFRFWKIVPNDFPYDRIAEIHHMIVPHRHAAESTLTQEEWLEYARIKQEHLHENYDYLLEASAPQRSIPGHFHLHLIVVNDEPTRS